MNSTTLDALRTQQPQREPADERMQQIRDLLVGDLQRHTEQRLAALEQRLDEFETTVSSRLAALHARLEALSGEMGADRRATFDELAHSVLELSEKIRTISRG
ncbi:MAG: hypothetical protein AB7E80_07720 [Hyphomicrobiaceae bacterium]